MFTCTASNDAGAASHRYNLEVLGVFLIISLQQNTSILFFPVPPTIKGAGGKMSVIENGTLMLPCESEGFPTPTVTWTKDGHSAESIANTEILSNGQQYR